MLLFFISNYAEKHIMKYQLFSKGLFQLCSIYLCKNIALYNND